MRAFSFHIAPGSDEAVQLSAQPDSQFLAGGTTLVDLMKLDVLTPQNVIDLNPLGVTHGNITVDKDGLHLGALVKMSDAARHPSILKDYPGIAQSLQLAASQQIRNMASLGGNVLQRTRCPYYRDVSYEACNKRTPGSGCSAMEGVNRLHAILGTSDQCIATYHGDFGTMLAALGASVSIQSATSSRSLPFDQLHRTPGNTPHVETNLLPGEIITGFTVPSGPWTRHSLYVKIRDRESYEFAVASAAVALHIQNGKVSEVRIALGGMATKPWRSEDAEQVLLGQPMSEELAQKAAAVAFKESVVHRENAFKPEIGRRTLVRALLQSASLNSSPHSLHKV